MINAQSLGLKKHSLVMELAEVFFSLSFFVQVSDVNFQSSCCVNLYQV
jgi:hypothetical protein